MRLIKSSAGECCCVTQHHFSPIRAAHLPSRAKEYQLQAELEHTFVWYGASASYGTIVGGGANACAAYVENSGVLEEDTLVLIDAGAEFDPMGRHHAHLPGEWAL